MLKSCFDHVSIAFRSCFDHLSIVFNCVSTLFRSFFDNVSIMFPAGASSGLFRISTVSVLSGYPSTNLLVSSHVEVNSSIFRTQAK